MSQLTTDEAAYFPTFEKREGQYYVQWRGMEWGLLTPIRDDWDRRVYGIYDHGTTQVSLTFDLLLLDEQPPGPKTVPDNIVLGEN